MSVYKRSITNGASNPEKPGNGFFGQGNQTEAGSQAKQSILGGRDSVASTRAPGTSEILFLKRLLFLKASLDNESTLNTLTVPFEQEKARDAATPDQLLLDTQAVLSGPSGRNSQGLDSYGMNHMSRVGELNDPYAERFP